MSSLDLNQITVTEPVPSSSLDLDLITGNKSEDIPGSPSLDLDKVTYTPPSLFFKHRQEDILSDVSSQFGGKTEFGRTFMQGLRGISGTDTDINRLHADLNDLNINNPELANSPEGKAYQSHQRSRIRSVLDADEMDTWETINVLLDKTIESPGEMIDIIGESIVEDPSMPLLFAAAYYTGGRSAHAAAKSSGLANLIAKMKMASKTSTRAAGISLEGAVDVMGVGLAEGGMGFVYEVAQNRAIGGRDPLHNAQAVAATSAILGGGIKGLGTAFKLMHGFPGRYKTTAEFFESLEVAGFKVPEIIDLLQKNMDDLPKASIDAAESWMRTKKIQDTKAPINPFAKRKNETISDPDKLIASLRKAYVDRDLPGDTTVSKIYEHSTSVNPVGSTVKRGVFYNFNKIVEDFNANFGYLKGETKIGKLGTSRAAQTRATAFKDFNFKEFEKWVQQNGGAKAYAKFLIALEANKLRYSGKLKDPGVDVYRRATYETLLDMGADPRQFTKFSKQPVMRTKLKLEAGYNYAKKTAQEVAANPALLWAPIKDVMLGTKQFADDVLYGPVEGKLHAARQRREISNMLRDWEGGRMAGELPINDFANYVKGHLKTQDKLNAMSHYLENNLDAYNTARREAGLAEITLTDKDLEIAPAIRKFFDDTLEWAQRSELYTQFRRNKKLYSAARNYTDGTQGVNYTKGKKGKDLQKEAWEYIKQLEDPRDVARFITPRQLRGTDRGYELRRRQNYVPHMVKRSFAPTDNEIQQMALHDALGLTDPHRASQLQTRSSFTKERFHDTLIDTQRAGNTLLTEDISSLIRKYGHSIVRSQINNRLMKQLAKTKSAATGKGMLGSKADMPDYYVEFKHPNFRDANGDYLYVNPNIAPDLRLYFDTTEPGIAKRVLENIIIISKRSALGLSLFHMMALGWSGLAAGQSPAQVLKNMVPMGRRFRSDGLKALSGEEGYDRLLLLMRNGLGVGVLEELKGDTLITALRRIGQSTENILAGNQYLKPIGKMGNMGFKGLARSQEIIDTHLWDHVNTGLKATTALVTLEKMVLRDAQQAAKEGRKPTNINILAQRAAQFTNDAYGNQNWNQMAMNVENHMGHRVAAALNKPSMRGYVRMLVFAPDWTLSNARVILKAGTGAYSKTRAPGSNLMADMATPEYMAYTLRSAILFATVAEMLQQASGQGSIFDDSLKDALRPDLGDGKQMEISKQLAEVIRLFIHGPVHVGKHKMGTLPKSLEHTDSIGEYLKFWGESSIPIGVRQAIKNEEASGIMGVPIYNKY